MLLQLDQLEQAEVIARRLSEEIPTFATDPLYHAALFEGDNAGGLMPSARL